jgi:hypothetical protein
VCNRIDPQAQRLWILAVQLHSVPFGGNKQ